MPSILLVDDEPANLVALHAVLQPLGYDLVDARSGTDALRLLLDRRFSVVLLDVRMPGMDGIATAALIRQRERTHGVPIVFLTAAAPDAAEVLRGYAEGAADYLLKPFDPGILRSKVQALVVAQQAAVEAELLARMEPVVRREREARREAEAAEAWAEEAKREAGLARKAEAEARREAERALQLKEQFLATLSHELRTPLMSILGWTRLLRLGKASAEPSGRALRSIELNARRQSRLVEELLDVQRFTAGKAGLSFRELPFDAVVQAAVAQVTPEAAEKRVSLRAATPHAEEALVAGDGERLQQMIATLLFNAVKFSAPGGQVRVVTTIEDADVVLVVSDDGRGMKPEFLARAFEPFSQEDSQLTRQQGGLGLGLSTVRGIVELHGGTVAAQSEGEGRGAAFLVTLPLRSRVPRPFAPAAAQQKVAAPAASLQGRSILVVDDDPDAQYLIATMLEQFGARVTPTGSAAEAMEALGRGSFDLVLSDISMPFEDGYSLMRRIRSSERGAQVPAVALTANARPEDRAQALAAGFQAHLAKPIEPSDLASVLAGLLEARRQPR